MHISFFFTTFALDFSFGLTDEAKQQLTMTPLVKDILLKILGIAIGIVIALLTALYMGKIGPNKKDIMSGATFFDQPGEVVDVPAFKVLQPIKNKAALVSAKNGDHQTYGEMFFGDVYLMYSDTNRVYQDNEIIRVPEGKLARQIGTFDYEAKAGHRTVPIITIMDR